MATKEYIRFGLEGLYLTVDNFFFYTKTFNIFDVCLHSSILCVNDYFFITFR
jgi:hypothetical protein